MTKTILFLAANPLETERLRLDEEVREIEDGLRRAKQRDNFVLRQRWALRPDDLRRAMLDYEPEIVHFSGHGAGQAGIVLEDNSGHPNLISTSALKEFFHLFPNVECVVLNVCYSEIQAKAISETVNYVVGISQQIGDAAAQKFSASFYDALGAGKPIDFAFQLGCNAIRLAGIPDNLEPTLFIRASKPEISNKADDAISERTLGLSKNSELFNNAANTIDSPNYGKAKLQTPIIQAEQMFYSRLEAAYSPISRSGYQVVYKTSGITVDEAKEIERHVQCFRARDVTTRYQYFHTSTQKAVLTCSAIITSPSQITDRSGRPGAFISHCLVFERSIFREIGNNPFEIFVAYLSSNKDIFVLEPERMIEIQTAQEGPIAIALAPIKKLEYLPGWDKTQLDLLLSSSSSAKEIIASNRSLMMISEDEDTIKNTLRFIFESLPPELRWNCTFETYSGGCTQAPGYYWATGGKRYNENRGFIQVQLDQSRVDFEATYDKDRAEQNHDLASQSHDRPNHFIPLWNKLRRLVYGKVVICPKCQAKVKVDNNTNYCIKCNYSFPFRYIHHYQEAAPLFLQVFGWTGHGKTIYLDTLQLLLLDMRKLWPDYTHQSITELGMERERVLRSQLRLGQLPPPTQMRNLQENEVHIMKLEHMARWGSKWLIMMDHAGEKFQGFDVPVGPFLLQTSTTFLLISIPMIIRDNRGYSIDQILNIYIETMLRYKIDFRKGNRNLVVVLTMADIIPQLPMDIIDYIQQDVIWKSLRSGDCATETQINMEQYIERMAQVSDRVREWLLVGTHGVPGSANLVALIEKNNIRTRYSVVSALGHDISNLDPNVGIQIMPKRVLDPFFWALEFEHSNP